MHWISPVRGTGNELCRSAEVRRLSPRKLRTELPIRAFGRWRVVRCRDAGRAMKLCSKSTNASTRSCPGWLMARRRMVRLGTRRTAFLSESFPQRTGEYPCTQIVPRPRLRGLLRSLERNFTNMRRRIVPVTFPQGHKTSSRVSIPRRPHVFR